MAIPKNTTTRTVCMILGSSCNAFKLHNLIGAFILDDVYCTANIGSKTPFTFDPTWATVKSLI